MLMGLVIAGVVGVIVMVSLIASVSFRTVVSTNDVHIVQKGKSTTSYGKDQAAGNVYYSWPSWMPKIGLTSISLPVSVFSVRLDSYAAYDKGRVPFEIDVMAFFRIEDTNVAAQRVHTHQELIEQLKGILQGACRSILATHEIEEILEGRGKFGEAFTKEVTDNLKAWGVHPVKCIELMDIRDANDSNVIENIMAKKKSLIEKQSRIEVAENHREAQEAEIIAQREVEMQKQSAAETVGKRAADREKAVGISLELSRQEIKAQEKVTAEKDMAVQQVKQVRGAEIAKDVAVVAAEQQKRTQVIHAEGLKEKTITEAQGKLGEAQLVAQGIEAQGKAKGVAEQAVLMAPVNAQITLAEKIGSDAGYQQYLVSIRQIEANEAIGIEQAKALEKADVKVIANTGSAPEGMKNVMDLFTSKGGTNIGAALEAFAQTEAGQAIVKKLLK